MQHYSLDLAQLIEQRNYNGIIALLISKIPLIVSAILILIIGFAVSNLIGRLVIKGLKAKGVDPSVHSFIRTCITLILKFAFILSAISTLGINVSSFKPRKHMENVITELYFTNKWSGKNIYNSIIN